MNSEGSVEERLEALERVVAENNKILRTMRRSQRIARAFSIFYWVIVIGLAAGAFYFIRPYVDSINDTVQGLDQFQNKVIDNFTSSVQDSFSR